MTRNMLRVPVMTLVERGRVGSRCMWQINKRRKAEGSRFELRTIRWNRMGGHLCHGGALVKLAVIWTGNKGSTDCTVRSN